MNDFETLEKLMGAKNAMEPFLRHIRFPKFKSLEPGFRLDFTYPITALVGKNGTNKSAILRALQGCPNMYNIGDYWFETSLDPIEGGDPQRYIHGYRLPSGGMAEVIKARVYNEKRGFDYFETSAPRRRDGMDRMPSDISSADSPFSTKTRWSPIQKNVVYLDFRQELPAYDILFYFNWRKRPNGTEEKKKAIRRMSPHVAAALTKLTKSHEFYSSERILEAAEELCESEVESVSKIVGKDYTSIRLVKHDYFGVEGYTARLSTGHQRYSEAYAGSGEFAAIMLVRAVSRAEENSLILLDEPETSLHPQAQKELLKLLARQSIEKHHQVVMATHAQSMIEDLPDHAIRILDGSSSDGLVRVIAQSSSPAQAFHNIGATHAVQGFIVEDELAKAIIERAARTRGQDYLASIAIQPVPGGAETIATRYMPVQAETNSSAIVLLDGDKAPADPMRHPSKLVDADLEAELKKLSIDSKHLVRNGGNSDSKEELVKRQRSLLAWIHDHVRYLPGKSPEELLLELEGSPTSGDSKQAKEIWKDRARGELSLLESENPSSTDILMTQRRALANIHDGHPLIQTVLEALGPRAQA